MRCWIFDKIETAQGFPLLELLKQVIVVLDATDASFFVTRARGYGDQVCELDEATDRSNEVAVSTEDLERLSRGTDEWFYDVEVVGRAQERTVRFGLHDSTALFVEAEAELVKRITSAFKDVRC